MKNYNRWIGIGVLSVSCVMGMAVPGQCQKNDSIEAAASAAMDRLRAQKQRLYDLEQENIVLRREVGELRDLTDGYKKMEGELQEERSKRLDMLLEASTRVEERMASLKQESLRKDAALTRYAEQSKNLQAAIKVLEVQAQQKDAEMVSRLAHADEAYASLDETRKKLEEEQATAANHIASLNSMLKGCNELETRLAQEEQARRALNAQLTDIQSALDDALLRADVAEADAERLSGTLAEEAQAHDDLQLVYNDALEAIGDSAHALAAQEEKNQELQASLAALNNERELMTKALDEAVKEARQLSEKNSTLEQDVAHLTRSLEQAASKEVESARKTKALIAEYDHDQAMQRQLTGKEIATLKEQLTTLNAAQSDALAMLQALESDKSAAEQALQDAAEQVAELSAALKEKMDALQQLQDVIPQRDALQQQTGELSSALELSLKKLESMQADASMSAGKMKAQLTEISALKADLAQSQTAYDELKRKYDVSDAYVRKAKEDSETRTAEFERTRKQLLEQVERQAQLLSRSHLERDKDRKDLEMAKAAAADCARRLEECTRSKEWQKAELITCSDKCTALQSTLEEQVLAMEALAVEEEVATIAEDVEMEENAALESNVDERLVQLEVIQQKLDNTLKENELLQAQVQKSLVAEEQAAVVEASVSDTLLREQLDRALADNQQMQSSLSAVTDRIKATAEQYQLVLKENNELRNAASRLQREVKPMKEMLSRAEAEKQQLITLYEALKMDMQRQQGAGGLSVQEVAERQIALEGKLGREMDKRSELAKELTVVLKQKDALEVQVQQLLSQLQEKSGPGEVITETIEVETDLPGE
ncbi:MAG: hypothetical protein EOL87_11960 [Spartobacteria bacterium]|nr:hypothetical protein [Spartobacteria bacterium]